MTNKIDKHPWKALEIEPGTLVKIDLNKSHITGGPVMFFCENLDKILCFYPEETNETFGLYLENVDHTRPNAKILVGQDIIYVHPKYLEVIDCERKKKHKNRGSG